MKTHRPWQPHMSNTPLFNPYTPAGHATTLDHFDMVEEEAPDEGETGPETPDEPAAQQAPLSQRPGSE
jgi:hypothetical protein